jgi:alpha,alpha-trehalose phosphorylase
MVEVTKRNATYTLLDGAPFRIGHHGKAITVSTKAPVTEKIPAAAEKPPAPSQPAGREPMRRSHEGT